MFAGYIILIIVIVTFMVYLISKSVDESTYKIEVVKGILRERLCSYKSEFGGESISILGGTGRTIDELIKDLGIENEYGWNMLNLVHSENYELIEELDEESDESGFCDYIRDFLKCEIDDIIMAYTIPYKGSHMS